MYSTTTASLVSMPIINFSAHFVLEFGGFSGVRRFSVDLRRRKYRFKLVSRDKMTRPLYPPGLQLKYKGNVNLIYLKDKPHIYKGRC